MQYEIMLAERKSGFGKLKLQKLSQNLVELFQKLCKLPVHCMCNVPGGVFLIETNRYQFNSLTFHSSLRGTIINSFAKHAITNSCE